MQKDLFGGAAVNVIPNQSFESKPDFLQRYRLNLRLDQAIIGALLFLIAYVFVFSFGVESGKRYAMAEIKAERSMREKMARELGEKIFANNQQAAQIETTVSSVKPAKAGESVKAALPAVELPSAVEAAPAESAAVKTKGKFAIQTITFTSKSAAEAYIKKLSDKGFQGKILPRGKFQQVVVTGYETKVQAMSAMGKLKGLGLAPKDAYIRSLA